MYKFWCTRLGTAAKYMYNFYIYNQIHGHFDFIIIPRNAACETDEEVIDEYNLLRDELPPDVLGELEF